jgi:hypothetical protein
MLGARAPDQNDRQTAPENRTGRRASGGESVRVNVRELRPLGQVKQQFGVLDDGDRVVDVAEFGERLAGVRLRETPSIRRQDP